MNKLFSLAVLGALVGIAALLLRSPAPEATQPSSATATTLHALKQLRSSRRVNVPCSSDQDVIVGYNSCVDLVVHARTLFHRLLQHRDASNPSSPLHVAASAFQLQEPGAVQIKSASDLARAFAWFFSRGTAVEKFSGDASFHRRLIALARELEPATAAIGGNAAIMGTCLAKQGCRVRLGSFYADTLQALVDASNAEVEGGSVQLLDEALEVAHDDVHLIVEYPKGPLFPEDEFGEWLQSLEPEARSVLTDPKLTSYRANRFILTLDSIQAQSTGEHLHFPDERVHDVLKASYLQENAARKLGMMVLSGFHLFDDVPADKRVGVLQRVVAELEEVGTSALKHVELACMLDKSWVKTVLRQLLPHFDSAGANEQETASFADVIVNDNLQVDGYDSKPAVADAVEQVATIMEHVGGLRRFHMHALQYQVICERPGGWPQNSAEDSLVEATSVASRRACFKEDLVPDDVELMFHDHFSIFDQRFAYNAAHPVSCATTTRPSGMALKCCVSPVLVCKTPLKTVGLGDFISASGLSVLV